VIRPATEQDADAIAAIWNHYIRNTLVTFNSTEKTAHEVAAMIETRSDTGCGTLVTGTEGAVQGFASYSPFRGGPGYAATAEHTILLAPGAEGAGLGRSLMTALAAHAAGTGKHALIAGISAVNQPAIDFHAAMGFAEVARLPEVGRKRGKWLDLVLMQKLLENPA